MMSKIDKMFVWLVLFSHLVGPLQSCIKLYGTKR